MKQLPICLLCILLLTGCAGQTSTPETISQEVRAASFQLYCGDETGEGFLSRTVRLNEISAASVLASLVAQGVLPEDIVLISLSMEDTVLMLDFNQAFQDLLCSQGTTGERMLLGSVVNTFLSAYQTESVLITVNGAALESGHMVYDMPISFMD